MDTLSSATAHGLQQLPSLWFGFCGFDKCPIFYHYSFILNGFTTLSILCAHLCKCIPPPSLGGPCCQAQAEGDLAPDSGLGRDGLEGREQGDTFCEWGE